MNGDGERSVRQKKVKRRERCILLYPTKNKNVEKAENVFDEKSVQAKVSGKKAKDRPPGKLVLVKHPMKPTSETMSSSDLTWNDEVGGIWLFMVDCEGGFSMQLEWGSYEDENENETFNVLKEETSMGRNLEGLSANLRVQFRAACIDLI